MSISRLRPYLLALGLLWLLPAGFTLVGYLVLDKGVHGQCEGIGFGCTPSDADLFLLLAGLSAPYVVGAGLIVSALIALVRHRRRTQP